MSSTTLSGIGVGAVAAVGPCVRFATPVGAPADEASPQGAEAIASEVERIRTALSEVSASLSAAAGQHAGQTLGEVLQAAAEIAADPELVSRSEELLGEGNGPATAVTQTFAEFAEVFRQLGGYMAERVADLNSVRDRTVARLLGVPEPGLESVNEPSVVVAQELTPADTSGLDMSKVLALVTEEGGPTSHTAIIARQLGLPCVVRVAGAMDDIPEGALVAVDGARGSVIVDPDQATQDALNERMERRKVLLADEAPGATSDGHFIQLLANIGTVADAERAAATAVEGVGLFRTEFMFLDAPTEPTIEAQTESYRKVLPACAGRTVG
ncbi:MAG: PEP-utilizing enzyme, partial [Arachnia sp.]